MVRTRIGTAVLAVALLVIFFFLFCTRPVRGEEPPAPREAIDTATGEAPEETPGEERGRPADPPPQGPAIEAPAPRPSSPIGKRPKEGDRKPRSAEDAEREARAREIEKIEEALLAEIDAVERRLRTIKARLRGGTPPDPRPPFGPGSPMPGLLDPPREGPGGPGVFLQRLRARPPASTPADPWLSGEEERRYRLLLLRQDEILERWRAASGRAGDEPPEAKGAAAKEKALLRSELSQVLFDILQLREEARDRQLRRLRREIEDIEKALSIRQGEAARKRMIDDRLRELLGP